MKRAYLSIAVLALLSVSAFASGEHCVTRNVIANYVGGDGVSTQCFSSESNFKDRVKDDCEKKR
jgi:hypothetical protein